MMKKMMILMSKFKLGFDLELWTNDSIKIPVTAPIGHLICVGGSGSGKSTALLYWLYQLKKNIANLDLTILDFKASHEFLGITKNYAEFESCYDKIVEFYNRFLSLQEGGNGKIHLLIIDEIAGLLTHFSMDKEGKQKADKIRQIMSSILMLGRSRQCFLWLIMQRYTATIFPASSGAVDNFHIAVGLGRLTVDGRKGLFAGEHLENEDYLTFGQGKGIVLIDGQSIQALILPRVSKVKLLKQLQLFNQKGSVPP